MEKEIKAIKMFHVHPAVLRSTPEWSHRPHRNEQFIWGKTETGTLINGDSITECKEQFLVKTRLVAAGVKLPAGTNPEEIPICVINLTDYPIKLYHKQSIPFFNMTLTRSIRIMTQSKM